MLGLKKLSRFSVSVSLLVLLAVVPAQNLSTKPTWPYDLPPHVKHFPGDEKLVQKKLEVQERMVIQRPLGLLKMSPEEGEMFFPEYWQFDPDGYPDSGAASVDKETSISNSQILGKEKDTLRGWLNASIEDLLEAPLKVHNLDQHRQVRPPSVLDWLPRMPRGLLTSLSRREFQCPGDTLSCAEIDRPNSCCPIGGTCQLISDSEFGDVGCCREGQTCSQQVVGCLNGYTSCPTSSGGGCCIPGYECVDVGCKTFSRLDILLWLTMITRRPYINGNSGCHSNSDPLASLYHNSVTIFSDETIDELVGSHTDIINHHHILLVRHYRENHNFGIFFIRILCDIDMFARLPFLCFQPRRRVLRL